MLCIVFESSSLSAPPARLCPSPPAPPLCAPQEEDEVPDDETVNQMIARSEEEFELFMVSVASVSDLIQTFSF